MRSLLMVVLVIGLAQAPGVAETAPWTISGTVTNHTGTPRPVAAQEVKLTAYVNGAEQEWKTAATDARGRFVFTVPADPQRQYALQVTYKGGEYDSPPIAFKAQETAKQVPIRVYEPTSDAGVLRISVHHIIVEASEGLVQVAELLVFTNPTDRTYIGGPTRADGKRETIRFTLPAGAGNVQYMAGLMECCVSATTTGMLDTMDVEPGMREIAYAYTLPASARTLALTRRLDYPTERVEVFGSAAIGLDVPSLQRQDDVRTDQGTYTRFSMADGRAGAEIRLALSGLPVPRSGPRRAAIAAFAGLVAAALAYPLLRRRQAGGSNAVPAQTRDELISAIAALDDRFEAGDLPASEYRQRRERYLVKLRRMAGATPAAPPPGR